MENYRYGWNTRDNYNILSLLFSEIALQQAQEALAMASFVLCHFVNSVVDGIQIGSLGSLGNVQFASSGATFSLGTLLQVGLGVPYHVTNQLAELGSMLGLFQCIATECLTDFRITLAVCLTGHSQIHTHLGAFALKMGLQASHNLLRAALGYTNLMLAYEIQCLIGHFLELAGRSLTLRAVGRCLFALIDITTYGTYKFFLHNCIILIVKHRKVTISTTIHQINPDFFSSFLGIFTCLFVFEDIFL